METGGQLPEVNEILSSLWGMELGSFKKKKNDAPQIASNMDLRQLGEGNLSLSGRESYNALSRIKTSAGKLPILREWIFISNQ